MRSNVGLLVELYKKSPNILCVFSAIAIFLIDIVTGENIHFPIFFAVPVGLAAWQLNRVLAYTLAILLPLLRLCFFYLWNDGPLDFVSVVNAFIIIVALSVYVRLTTIHVLQKQALEKELDLLKGNGPQGTSVEKR